MKKSKMEVLEVVSLGIGTRVSIDFIDELEIDEYILVGNVCKGFVGISPEWRTTETYPPRRFRFNTGAVHQYIYIDDDKIKYLSEIIPGDIVSIFSAAGVRKIAVGRVKKEKREMYRVVLKDDSNISATLQYADSVYLVSDQPICITNLKVGDVIYAFESEFQATHKGTSIEEYIVET